MQISFVEIAILVITISFTILLVLFVIQSIRRHRTAKMLLLSLFSGFFAGIVTILGSGELFPLSPLIYYSSLSFQLNLYGFQFFFFYLFLEQLISEKFNSIRLTAVFSILFIQTISLWLIIVFLNESDVTKSLWFLADMAYMVLGLVVYLGFGFMIYLKTCQYTHEIKSIIFSISMAVIGSGFIIIGIKDYCDFFGISIPFVGYAVPLSNGLYAIGLIIFTITYVFDIDYIYRLPNDIFLLMVLTKAGIPLHTIKLKTRRQVDIESDLLSGLISAINNVFEEVFKSATTIQNISSEQVHLLMEPGEKIVCLVITDKLTYFLSRALKRYAIMFEKEFSTELNQKRQDTLTYRNAIKLIKPIFPFFKVDKIL